MSYVKKEGAKKRKVDTNAGLSVGDMKDMYSLEEDGLEIVEMDESEENAFAKHLFKVVSGVLNGAYRVVQDSPDYVSQGAANHSVMLCPRV